ncbi:MAG: hypothetical protein MJE68_16720 [Proteobacteria bacterium]|nr:hypothetical protein [Pseudomonadota bacterium]
MLDMPAGDIHIHGTAQQPERERERERLRGMGRGALVFTSLAVTDFCCTAIH